MICNPCHGKGVVRRWHAPSGVDLPSPCPECGGCGISHCCDGDQPTVRDEVLRAAQERGGQGD